MVNNVRKNLLVELFVEELPPKALKKLGQAFAQQLAESLKAQGLAASDAVVTAYASPRRLAAHITAVVEQAINQSLSQKLMPISVGLDASGQATPALLKKLASLGTDASVVAQLKRQQDGKAEALYFDSVVPGARLTDGLQKALEDSLSKLPIPKVMQYQLADGWSSVNFVRPAHGLVALHGDAVIAIEALGLKADRITHGHRFEASVNPIVLKDANSYATQLETEGAVIASFAARRAEIERQLHAAAAKAGGTPIHDEALLDEVTALVERPNVLICQFEKEFLDVPQECLILTMKANQKYFPLLNAQGKLTNQFLVVSNITPADPSRVIEGNERVVRPRLADAKFFFDQDRKKKLENRVAGLTKVVYHNKLGTQGERVERVRAIAQAIGQQLGGDVLAAKADQAARLAKADLLTDMVGEFPELQGIMGRYYALHDGLDADVADAIEDHYKPRFAGDELPRNEVGLVVALADKLETIVGLFGIGQRPTGDKDPFALRRHALGVIRLVIECNLPINANTLVNLSYDKFPRLFPNAGTDVLYLMGERLSSYCRELGYSAAEVGAVVGAGRWLGLAGVPAVLSAVHAFAQLPEAPALAAANKRVANILKKNAGEIETVVDENLLQESAEKVLYAALIEVGDKAASARATGDYTASLQALAALKEPVDAFFKDVMVNVEDEKLRINRLALLAQLHRAMNRVADLSKLAA